jgi:CxxC-x17-CxxC domain-containing protein
MRFTEKLLHCTNCKKDFIFTVENQEYRSFQGYPNDPANCPTCRRARKSISSIQMNTDGDSGSNRQTYPVTCTQCGKAVRVPFQPRPGRPVYCSDCQMKTRSGG